MKWTRRLLGLLLVIALLLVGCDTQPPVTQPPATQPPTTPPTDPPPTEPPVAARYVLAKAALDAAVNVELEIAQSLTMSLVNDRYSHTSSQTLMIQGYNTDTPVCFLTDDTQVGNNDLLAQEYYADGTAYVQYGGVIYQAQTAAQDYLDRFLPAALMDEALYGSITAQENADGTTRLVFTQPAQAESWLDREGLELSEMAGYALLDASDTLLESGCTVRYSVGSAEYNLSVTVKVNCKDEMDLSGKVPDPTQAVVTVSHIDIPYLAAKARLDIEQAKTLSTHYTHTISSQAAGAYVVDTEQFGVYTPGGTIAKMEYDSTVIYSDNSKQSYTQLLEFKGSQYTLSENGGEPVTYTSTPTFILNTCREIAAYNFVPMGAQITDVTIEDLGSVYSIICTMSEDYAEQVYTGASERFFGDASYLDGYASAYRVEHCIHFLTIDKATGLPVGAGADYLGIHTIDGVEYEFACTSTSNLTLAGDDAYEYITGEPVPDVEPENKATPVFYKVTGPDGQQMWLFGTIHMGDSRTAYLPDEIYNALEAADALAVEFDMLAFQERLESSVLLQSQVYKHYCYSDGSTIDAHLDPEVYEYATSLLRAYGAYNANMEYMKASVWQSAIEDFLKSYSYSLSGEKGVDMRLLKLAKAQGKPIYDIESGMSQLRMLMGFSDGLQETMLASSLSTTSLSYRQQVTELYELWCLGDEEALRQILADDLTDATDEEKALYAEYKKAVSTDRNADMLKTAIDYLQSGETVFFAVGLAHLLEEDGLVNTLRQAGYSVELVQYA